MEQSIQRFNEQLVYEPKLENSNNMRRYMYKSYVLCGMGGSHLAADFLRDTSNVDITIHSDYDLPKHYNKKDLFIISSFSGNTEETLSSYHCAKSNNLDMIVITSENSQLLSLAKEDDIPYIALPDLGNQPRLCIGLFLRALSYICVNSLYKELEEVTIDVNSLQGLAKHLVALIDNKIPIIYTSNSNKSIGYNWKIKFNETAKIPAFCNTFPELNHNEMNGYDILSDKESINKYAFIFLYDFIDPRITKRMDILFSQLNKLGYQTINLDIGKTTKQRLETVLIADWASYFIAINNNVDPQQVKMIEEFKDKLKD